MKTIKTTPKMITLCLGILLAQSGIGQCKNFIKHTDFSVLKSYECEGIKVAQMYRGDQTEIPQVMESSKRYRIFASAQKHLGDLKVSIKSAQGKEIGIKVENKDHAFYEVMVSEKQEVHIKLEVNPTLAKTRINTAGCVAVAIGEMDNTNVAVIP